MTDTPEREGACGKQLVVIDALHDLGGGGVSEIAEYAALPKSTVHYHLQILSEKGYVVRDGRGYDLGLRFLELGERTRSREALFEVAKPEIDDLASETGELALLMVEEHGRGVYLYKATGEDAIDVDAPIGRRAHLHNRALGKAILSAMSDDRVEAVIDRHGLPATTDRTVTDREELFEELSIVRERGVAFNDQESVDGMRGIAVPVVEADDVLGALSVAGPVTRVGRDETERNLIDLLNRARNVVELSVLDD